MKTLQILAVIMAAGLLFTSCSESDCEMNNMGSVVIHNNSTNSKLWLTLDKKFGPGLSSADHEILAGESVKVDIPAGVHTLDGVFTTPLGNRGTQMSSVDEKEVVLEVCAEVNVYYDL